MIYKAKETFLWYEEGVTVPEHEVEKHPHWKKHLNVVESEPVSIVKETVEPEPNEKEDMEPADVNKDGKVDLKDAVEVVKRFGRRKKSRKR